jgi:hypothetical protein
MAINREKITTKGEGMKGSKIQGTINFNQD